MGPTGGHLKLRCYTYKLNTLYDVAPQLALYWTHFNGHARPDDEHNKLRRRLGMRIYIDKGHDFTLEAWLFGTAYCLHFIFRAPVLDGDF